MSESCASRPASPRAATRSQSQPKTPRTTNQRSRCPSMLWNADKRRSAARVAGLMLAAVVVAVFVCKSQQSVTAEPGGETAALIESALYARHEFFGAQAIVPYPTAEARNRLAAVLEKHPDTPQILLKLAQLDEKLGREEEAVREMHSYVEHETDKPQALTTLADFFQRRAQFAAEAESLERLIRAAPAERRVEIFRNLIELAEQHRLDKYLAPSFYEQIIKENPAAFEIVEQYQDKLIEQKKYEAALSLLRQNKNRFPEHRADMLEK